MDLINNKNRGVKYYKVINSRREYLLSVSVPDLDGEYWVDIPEYEGHYKISNLFRIKSLGRIVDNGRGSSVCKKSQLLRPAKNSDGYLCVILTKERVTSTFSVHVLMGSVFVPNPLNLPEINHKDGNKLNCLPDNLEWNTRKQNIEHAVKNGFRKYVKGVNTGRYSIPKEDIMGIFNSKGDTLLLAKKYGVTKSSIQRIRNGQTYSNITFQPLNQ